jgi:outer membrane receptor protein involved in Fe transport
LPDAEALFLYEYYDDDNDGVPDGGWFGLGNPNLKPEKSENINLAIGGNAGDFTYEFIAFERTITDYIDSYVPLIIAGVEGESFVNSHDEVQVDGFEFIGSLRFSQNWSGNFSLNSTNSEFNGDGVQLTGIPETEIKLAANYESSARPLGVSITVDRVGDINARRGQRRGDYNVLDVAAFYNLGANEQHQLVLRIENLTDEEYASRVDIGTLDLTGSSYIYDNLGMSRTLHASYTHRF